MALDALVRSDRVNAIAGWSLVAIVVLGALESLLTDALLWGGFSLLLATVASLPALTRRDWQALVPWPILFGAAVAVVARAVDGYPEVAGHLAIATLALVVVVELDLFTPVELGRRFAVVFGVLTTLAIEALWIVAQYYADVWLGTEYLTTQTALQEDIALVTVVGFVVGTLYYWFLPKFAPAGTDRRSASGVEPR